MSNPTLERIGFAVSTRGHATEIVYGGVRTAYTIGLYEKYGYEIIGVYRNPEVLGKICDIIVDELKEGRVFDTNVPFDDLTSFPIVLRDAIPNRHMIHTVQATEYHGKVVPFRQMILTDKNGCFPWHQGYNYQLMDSQELLFDSRVRTLH